MRRKPEIINVSDLFINIRYVIPIYQRNYSWEEEHIQQLIDDINSSTCTYFLGNLIVNQQGINAFEVIDGQQRLTTLYLLQNYLNMDISQGALYFEAREKSNQTLKVIGTDKVNDTLDELLSEELRHGYQIIEHYFISKHINRESFLKKLKMVQLIRIQVPKDIDLNHYFEVMNTRGEQLELHEIAKAKLLSKLSTDEDKEAAALIWDACSKMDTYVQMNVDKTLRNRLFSKDWSELQASINDFNEIKKNVLQKREEILTYRTKSLREIITDKKQTEHSKKKDEEENDRFRSILSFPNFLLQVNEAMAKSNQDESLDDKNFLRNLKKNWEDEEKAKSFFYHLLKCRVLFDSFILKREFTGDDKEDGAWSLQRLKAYKSEGSWSPSYAGTYRNVVYNKKVRALQSCLRITYTSPKTMHWVSLVLRNLLHDPKSDLLALLENYAIEKVKESRYMEVRSFNFERIVFTYLDYILYRDGYSYGNNQIFPALQDDWEFQFRNSIEHFYPQNPIGLTGAKKWGSRVLHGFGNLALITVSGNSKFSNAPPKTKVDYDVVVKQSLKLRIMTEMTLKNNGVWDQKNAKEHEQKMFALLAAENKS